MALPKIRMDQFVKQLEEIGVDDLQPIEVAQGVQVWIKLGVGLDVEEAQGFNKRVQASETSEEAALEILGHHSSISAEAQLQTVLDNGWTAAHLVAIWGAATATQREEMGKVRAKRS